MELFDKIYGCYYQVVRHILMEAADRPIKKDRIRELSLQYGYQESALSILPKLTDGDWPLLTENLLSVLKNPEILKPGALPLTRLQKAWLAAVLSDPRAKLFFSDESLARLKEWLADTEPLFREEDFYYFDRYSDLDDYGDPDYRERFQTILTALKEKQALFIAYENRRGLPSTRLAAPYQLQYSSRDGKFRLCCMERTGKRFSRGTVLNLNRIKACHPAHEDVPPEVFSHAFSPVHRAEEPVVIEIGGERNSLERCMLHFANYEKHTRYNEETKTWICSIYYDMADETELLIEILSFGPVIRVLGPESFLSQIRARVIRQHELLYGDIPSAACPDEAIVTGENTD